MSTCVKCGKKGLLLKVDFQGLCENCQKQQLDDMQAAMLPEHRDILALRAQIQQMNDACSKMSSEIDTMNHIAVNLDNDIMAKRALLFDLDDDLLMQDFALYKPHFDFVHAEDYKNRIAVVRQQQRDMIKSETAVTGNMGWTVNGSVAQGKKMVKDMQKLLLRAFNSECDSVIEKVKFNNLEASLKRLSSSATAISKLGAIMNVAITSAYYSSKEEELYLALEYQQKKQREKEEQKAAREQMREEAKLAREIEEARRKTEKELGHYENALEKLKNQIESAEEDEKGALLEKLAEIENRIEDANKALQDIDYRSANQRAGYVYVISNIGSFGENVYKIGMTRRLDPEERVDELGDASVPFNFDIHAMIFSDDAPALEAALHREFESKKLNMINSRREFFHVTLDEIKAVVKANYDKIAEFIDVPEAEQFRESQKMR